MLQHVTGLSQFLRSIETDLKSELADEAGTTVAYLDQLAGGHRRPSTSLSQALVGAAKKLDCHLTLNDCRPDIWKDKRAA